MAGVLRQFAQDLHHCLTAWSLWTSRRSDPGYTAIDLNGFSRHQILTEGTESIVTAAVGVDVPATYSDRTGPLSW